jgi:hypothetical protein
MRLKMISKVSIAVISASLFALDLYAATCLPAGSNTAFIACINAAGPGDTVDLGGFTYTFTAPDNLSPVNGDNALPVIAQSLTIQNGIIQRSTGVGIPAFRFLEVDVGGDLTLINITFLNGLASGITLVPAADGGAILVLGGTISLINNCTFENNFTNLVLGFGIGMSLERSSSSVILRFL